MTILLLGATGQLGRTFIEHGGLAQLGRLTATSRQGGAQAVIGHTEAADLAEPQSLLALLDRLRPSIIVNTAAYTAVDLAETDQATARRVNADGVGVLAKWAAEHHALVVHYSTDYIFDGNRSTPYPIDAPTGPLGVYGASKLAGEIALRQSGAAHFIFRTSWVYAAHGTNFLRTMLRLAQERSELNIVADQRGSPTSTILVVNGTLAALRCWQQANRIDRIKLQGTHHLVASGVTSWHGFASTLFTQAHGKGLLARIPKVQAIESIQFPTAARRPAYSVLDNVGFERSFGYSLPSWQDALLDVIDSL